MNELVRMSGIRKTYDGVRYVLDSLDFYLGQGELAVVFGASGCGKSTLLNIIGLLDQYNEGNYWLNGTEILPTRLNKYYAYRARDIGFVFQAYFLIESISVEDNILMPFLYNDEPLTSEIYKNLDNLLECLEIGYLKSKTTKLLSGGERQRVAIARALLKKPKLIIADEPTGNLDEKNALLVLAAFHEATSEGSSVVIVTHNRHLRLNATSTYELEEGRLRLCANQCSF